MESDWEVSESQIANGVIVVGMLDWVLSDIGSGRFAKPQDCLYILLSGKNRAPKQIDWDVVTHPKAVRAIPLMRRRIEDSAVVWVHKVIDPPDVYVYDLTHWMTSPRGTFIRLNNQLLVPNGLKPAALSAATTQSNWFDEVQARVTAANPKVTFADTTNRGG